MDYLTEEKLLKRMQKSEPFSLVLGAALTAEVDGKGIPGVNRVPDFVLDYIKEQDDEEDYNEHIGSKTAQEKYQASIQYISEIYGQNAVNKIISSVISSNIDTNTKDSYIPQSVKGLAKLIQIGKVKTILTTNFDTLIEEELTNLGVVHNSISIVSDSNIPKNSNELPTIVHLHGKWTEGDTMHTESQLKNNREKIQNSIRNIISKDNVYIMAYGGWEDSFTRTLASIVHDNDSNYEISWCFYNNNAEFLDKQNNELFTKLSAATDRGRIKYFKGINCHTIFNNIDLEQAKKKSTIADNNITVEVQYSNIANFPFYNNVRKNEQQKTLRFLLNAKIVFIEANFGSGLLKFLGSALSSYLSQTNFLKINLEGCITKIQVEEKILADTKLTVSALVLYINEISNEYFCVIFERINPKINDEALNYIIRLSSDFRLKNKNIYFVFSSAKKIEQLSTCSVKLERLTQLETSTVLFEKYGDNKLSQRDAFAIHELTEGVVSKLDHVMNFLNDCSADELLTIDDLFDDVYYDENLSRATRDNIELLAKNPNRSDTFLLLKILAVLKNGESIKTIRNTKIGVNINPRNTQELTSLELASSVTIDPTTTIIRLNTIVKDYVLKITPIQEINNISKEFLPLTIITGKEKIVLSSINRKTMEHGLKTEEDNAVTLLKNNIGLVKQALSLSITDDAEHKNLATQLNRLMYLSQSYVYGLLNSSRFTEAATATHSLLKDIEDVKGNKSYVFYAYLAFTQRMLGKHVLALEYAKKAKEMCPTDDKATLRDIAIDELYLLEKLSPSEAISLAKTLKNENKANSNIYIISDVILSNSLPTKERIEKLKSNERKARRLKYHTTANNLLLTLNPYLKTQEKLSSISTILATEKSDYNTCRAKIAKYEFLLENGDYDKITNRSIAELKDIYNYLFFQGLESLFNRCHELLWEIAVQREINELLENIFFQGILIWRLNNDAESEAKYKRLFDERSSVITVEDLQPLK